VIYQVTEDETGKPMDIQMVDEVPALDPVIADKFVAVHVPEPAPAPAIIVIHVPEPVSEPSSNGLFFPKANRSFLVQDDMVKFLERVNVQRRKHPINILLIGNQGSGKTSLAEQFAAKNTNPCYIAPCVTMTEPIQWWGYTGVSPERGTYYVPSAFVKAIETPNCVIILDDMNRVENPKVLNPLFPLLDDRRETHLDELGRSVKVAEGVVFFATINEGYQFQGTDPIDLALRDRFDQVPVSYPPSTSIAQILHDRSGLDHVNCSMVADFAGNLAGHPTNPIILSMRQLIRVAEHMADGANARDAVHFTLMASFKPKDMEIVKMALQQLLKSDYMAVVSGWRKWGEPDGS
jgi:nitric oxide reductase NorQ protein